MLFAQSGQQGVRDTDTDLLAVPLGQKTGATTRPPGDVGEGNILA
jgi:hypothetical protein